MSMIRILTNYELSTHLMGRLSHIVSRNRLWRWRQIAFPSRFSNVISHRISRLSGTLGTGFRYTWLITHGFVCVNSYVWIRITRVRMCEFVLYKFVCVNSYRASVRLRSHIELRCDLRSHAYFVLRKTRETQSLYRKLYRKSDTPLP